jgi:hypothetical protein
VEKLIPAGADAILGVSLFADVAPDDFGKFNRAFAAVFRIAAGDAWIESLPIIGPDGDIEWQPALFTCSFIVVNVWVVLQVSLQGVCVCVCVWIPTLPVACVIPATGKSTRRRQMESGRGLRREAVEGPPRPSSPGVVAGGPAGTQGDSIRLSNRKIEAVRSLAERGLPKGLLQACRRGCWWPANAKQRARAWRWPAMHSLHCFAAAPPPPVSTGSCLMQRPPRPPCPPAVVVWRSGARG